MNDLLNLAYYALLVVLAVLVSLLFMFFLGVTKVLVLIGVSLVLGAVIGLLLPVANSVANAPRGSRGTAAVIHAVGQPASGDSKVTLCIRDLDEKALQSVRVQAAAVVISINSLEMRRWPAACGAHDQRPSQSAVMPTLPEHITALQGDLHPILATLYRALHSPDSLWPDAVVGGVSSQLTRYHAALIAVFEALRTLKDRVFDQPACAEATRRHATTWLAVAVDDLAGVYGTVLTLLADGPSRERRVRLGRNQRANLERLAMFLADLVMTLAEPRRILLEGRPVGETSREIEFRLNLSYPEDLAELDAWSDTPTGYDAGHVREALAIARTNQGGMAEADPAAGPGAAFSPPAVPGEHRGADWLTSLVFVLMLGNLLSDGGCDGDVHAGDE